MNIIRVLLVAALVLSAYAETPAAVVVPERWENPDSSNTASQAQRIDIMAANIKDLQAKHLSSTQQLDDMKKSQRNLVNTVAALNQIVHTLMHVGTEVAERTPGRDSGRRSAGGSPALRHEPDGKNGSRRLDVLHEDDQERPHSGVHTRQRQLTTGGGQHQHPAISIEQPGAAIHFAPEQTSIKATAHKQLHIDGSLRVRHDLAVDGKLLTDGTFLNLGVPLNADMPVQRGSLVSLVPGGGVEPGFGLDMTPDVASTPAAHELSTVWVGGNATVTLAHTGAGTVSAVYHDLDAQAPEAAVVIGGGGSLHSVSAAGLAPIMVGGNLERRLVVCYVVSSGPEHGQCALGVWRAGAGLDMGSPLAIHSGSRYMGGAVSGVGGSSTRVVLVYNVQATPGVSGTAVMTAQVLAVQGMGLVTVGSAVSLVPGATSHHSLVWLSTQRLMLAYRADQLSSGHCRELYFDTGAPNVLKARPILDLMGVDNPVHMRLERMSDTHAVVAYRLASDLYRVFARSVDASSPLTSVGEAVLVDAGTTVSPSVASYAIGMAAGSSTRFVLSFVDATGRMMLRDAGVYGTSISLGNAIPAHADGAVMGVAASLSDVGARGSMRVVCVVQALSMGSASMRVGRLYGGPTVLGFAKSDAVAGESVYVVLDGGVSGFTGLVPGSLYYARSDGSVGLDSGGSGDANMIAGKAMSTTVLKSLVSADGPGNRAWLGEVAREVEASKLREASVLSRLTALEAATSDHEGRMVAVETNMSNVTARIAALENVTSTMQTDVHLLHDSPALAMRGWSGYDSSNMGGNSGWQRLRLSATRYDTTDGELTAFSNYVQINKPGWYEISYWYDERFCHYHYAQLYAGGVQQRYAGMDNNQHWNDATTQFWRGMLHLDADDTVYLEIYSGSCGSSPMQWYGGVSRNGLELRTLVLD